MYELRVFKAGEIRPVETVSVLRAADALTRIQNLLAAHPGCERVEVRLDDALLFNVDCHGDRIS